MTNKIVILDNSVELYEHYISDEKWEKTVSFPKGGLTFNISNGTIKFFAFEDYLYKNCIISMQLPIYIVDRDGGVDGEYDDPSEIGEILDRIFPNASGTEIDLTAYLKKREAAEIYQPKGDYALRSEIPDVTDFVTDEDLVEALDDYYTKSEVDSKIPSLDGYATQQWVEDQHYITGVDLSDYATKEYVSGYTYDKRTIDEKIAQGGTFDPTQYYTKTATDALLDEKLDASAYTPTDLSNYYTKGEVDGIVSGITASGVTRQEMNEAIASAKTEIEAEIPSLDYYVTFDDMTEYVGDVYTKTEVDNLFVNKETFETYIINMQQQIDSLKAAISGCCGETGETVYRWIVVPNDYECNGTTKMTKEKEQSSTDGINWTDTGQYRAGSTVLEYNSEDCGYTPPVGNYKIRATYKRGYTVGSGQVECNSSTTITNDEAKQGITFLEYFRTVEFGTCIDTIGKNALLMGRNIESITIPSNITRIESGAFGNCGASSAVTNYTVTLNEGLQYIGNLVFDYNINLKTITIPSTVTHVGSQAFYLCKNLETVTIKALTPPEFGSEYDASPSIFNGCDSLTAIYVPAQSVNAYKSARGWRFYSDIIYPISSLNS